MILYAYDEETTYAVSNGLWDGEPGDTLDALNAIATTYRVRGVPKTDLELATEAVERFGGEQHEAGNRFIEDDLNAFSIE